MRRTVLPALMILLLLCGCGTNRAEGKLKAQREALKEAEEISFTAHITARTENEVFSCSLDCTASREETVVTVTAPALIAGIRARTDETGTKLEYDGLSLGIGAVGSTGITPVSAAPLLAYALRSGFQVRSWTERGEGRELLAEELYITETAALTVWYDGETLVPIHCEFAAEGETLISCDIENYTYR